MSAVSETIHPKKNVLNKIINASMLNVIPCYNLLIFLSTRESFK